ncbi:hypothetical protein SAMN02745751_01739 [Dethiosulfatibacter aminovorans DSM 17477]|uniref:Uncharacterized protein n=1 Tax=Dethiosulfatibacter aminovorans DSM 17477 TaxID=1121476 RepID=A0A1M6GG09_9FIRM|nr:hypothetical protein [Dethiosulfatibacter aminovorans]SHJ08904.1 hypothetical protein SAMN02745751_01739 [Dethiosulfatibacter aminovorans DSM 17477]
MNGIIVLVVLIISISIGLTKLNRIGGSHKKIAKMIAIALVLLFMYIIFLGPSFRLSGKASAMANAFIDKEHEWIGMIELNGNEFHMFYDPVEEEYMTVFVDKLVIGFRSNTSVHLNPHFEDSIRTIGTMNMEDEGRLYSVFMIDVKEQGIDKLALIDAKGNILSSQEVNADEPTQIAYVFTGKDDYFNCELVAINKSGERLYYYGYEHGENHLREEEYKWHAY